METYSISLDLSGDSIKFYNIQNIDGVDVHAGFDVEIITSAFNLKYNFNEIYLPTLQDFCKRKTYKIHDENNSGCYIEITKSLVTLHIEKNSTVCDTVIKLYDEDKEKLDDFFLEFNAICAVLIENTRFNKL